MDNNKRSYWKKEWYMWLLSQKTNSLQSRDYLYENYC